MGEVSRVSREVALERGRAALRAGRFAEGLRHFREASDLDAGSADAWHGQGQALASIGRFAEALETFERARTLDPAGHGAAAAFEIGQCHVGLDDLDAAITCFDRALAVDADLDRVWQHRGMALYELGRREEAAASWARAAELDPGSAATCLWRGHCLRQLGRDDEADACFAQAARTNAVDDIARTWMAIGAHLHAANQVDQALAAYDRALELWPRSDVAWVRRGACLVQLQREDDAGAAFDRAIALDGQARLTALADKAALLTHRGRRSDGAAIYRRVLDAPPAAAQDHRARAQAFLALRRPDEALDSIALASRLDPHDAEDALLRGACLDLLGRYADAAAAFAEGAARHRRPEAWFRQARCLLMAGEPAAALTCCETAASLDAGPPDERAFVHGVALAQLDRFEEAITQLATCVELDAAADGAWANLGGCRAALGRHAEALADFDRALEINGRNPDVLRSKARAYDALGREAESNSCAATGLALELLDAGDEDGVTHLWQATRLDPGNWLATRVLADLHFQAGALDDAAALLGRVVELRPGWAEAWTTRGAILSRLGRGEEADACCTHALEIGVPSPMALRNAGLGLVERGRHEEALPLFEQALAAEHDSANGWYGKGVSLARLDRLPEAVEAFRTAVALDPDDASAWEDLGTCLTMLTRYREAAEAWAQVERLRPDAADPDDPAGAVRRHLREGGARILPNVYVDREALGDAPTAPAARAYALLDHGEHAGALAAFDEALALDPTSAELWLDRGICVEVVEGSAAAIVSFDRALALEPEAPTGWYNRGVSLSRLDRHEEAVEALDRVVALHRAGDLPVDADLVHAHFNMAVCLLQLHRWEEALDAFDEVVALARHEPDRWPAERERTEEMKRALFAVLS